MQKIPLQQAVGAIYSACTERRTGPGQRAPFFFLVGAGISNPPVPLASMIVKLCRERSGQAHPTDGARVMDDYSASLARAFPHPSQRQRFFRSLIENQPLPHATLRLAYLLIDGQITNLVLTPNFDDFLSRSLALLGKQHIVCDHPSTTERIDPDSADVQIVHIHGSYWFYDCINLTGEIAGRSQRDDKGVLSMASLLDRCLAHSSPIVVGYSGWEQDVFMQALRRRMQGWLPYNIYWFCYSDPTEQDFPEWLRKSETTFFVVPDGDVAQTSRLPAHKIFDEMNRVFKLPRPKLFTDPLGFFANQIRASYIESDDIRSDEGMFPFRHVLNRIDAAKEFDERERSAKFMEPIRELLHQAHYVETIEAGTKIPIASLVERDLNDFADVILSAAWYLNDNSDTEVAGYSLVIQAFEFAAKQGASNGRLAHQAAMAGVNKGLALASSGRNDEAIMAYDGVIVSFDEATELGLKDEAAKAHFNKADILATKGQYPDAIREYDAVALKYSGSSRPTDIDLLARALINKGASLEQLRRYREARNCYKVAQNSLKGQKAPNLRRLAATVKYNLQRW